MAGVTEEYPAPTDADAPDEEGNPELPYNVPAERSALGSILLRKEALDEVLDEVRPEDFWDPKHEVILGAILRLRKAGTPVDVLTVSDELTRCGEVNRAGGLDYLHRMTGETPTAFNAPWYAQQIHEAGVRRRLVQAGTRITQMSRATEGLLDTIVADARAELDAALTGSTHKVRPIGQTIDDLIGKLDETPEYFPSPWSGLDRLIAGLAPGRFYVVGARPGAGKSIACLSLAIALAKRGAVAMSSLEMPESELQMRMLAQFGPVHLSSLTRHAFVEDDWVRICDARNAMRDAPIFIDDRPGQSMQEVRAHARSVARQGNLRGVVVDYLQLLQVSGEDRRLGLEAASRDLKRLAQEFHVPVIAAVQLRRAGQRKGLPGLDDIREAGGIEQDADVVLLLDRDVQKNPGRLTVIVAKNRHGEQGKFTLRWQGEYSRLLDLKFSPSMLEDEELSA